MRFFLYISVPITEYIMTGFQQQQKITSNAKKQGEKNSLKKQSKHQNWTDI